MADGVDIVFQKGALFLESHDGCDSGFRDGCRERPIGSGEVVLEWFKLLNLDLLKCTDLIRWQQEQGSVKSQVIGIIEFKCSVQRCLTSLWRFFPMSAFTSVK